MHKSLEIACEQIKKQLQGTGVDFEWISVESHSQDVSFENRQISELSTGASFGLGVRFIQGDKESFFHTESLEPEDLQTLCKNQLEALKYVKSNPNINLDLKPEETSSSEMDLFFDHDLATDQQIERVRSLEDSLWKCDPRVKNVTHCSMSKVKSESILYTRDNRTISQKRTRYSVYGSVLCHSNETLASGGYGYSRYDLEDLPEEELLVEKIKEASTSLLDYQVPKTGVYPCIIRRKAFSGLIQLLAPMFSADQVDKGFSLLKGKLNSKIASSLLELSDEPHNVRGAGAQLFDGEGFIAKKTPLIQNGILQNYLTNSEYANKLNLQNNFNATRSASGKVGIGPSNLIVRPGTMKLSVLRGMRPQIVEICNLQGLHVGFNAASGDFSF